MLPLLISAFVLEKREYNENATEEELKAIESRVSNLDDRIVIYKEVPVISSFTASLMLRRTHTLLTENGIRAVIFDLQAAKPPSFKVRNTIYKHLKLIVGQADYVYFCSGKNKLVNIAAQFVLNSSKFPGNNIVVMSSYDEALKKIHENLK